MNESAARLDLAIRRQLALQVLSIGATAEHRARLRDLRESISRMSRPERRHWLGILEKDLVSLKKHVGATDVDEIRAWFERLFVSPRPPERHPDADVHYVYKAQLAPLFTRYENALPAWPTLPPHALIAVDLHGLLEPPRPHYRLLEAMLFEDLAAQWNMIASMKADWTLDEIDHDREQHKLRSALLRSVVRAAFALVEGYLAGLATDILLEYRTRLTVKQQETLFESDAKSGRPRFLRLRDKLLQYPKLAIGATHPPVDDSHSSAMKYLVAAEPRYRHIFVHPKPVDLADENADLSTTERHFLLSDSEVAELCDKTVELIQDLDAAIESRYGGTSAWLRKRDATGRFPGDVFD